MLFNSFEFVGLVLATLVAFYLPPLRRHQTPVLIVASLVFFAYHVPAQLLLLLASIAINAVASHAVVWEASDRRRRAWATLGVLLNLSILAFFKYTPLLARTFLPSATVRDEPVGAFLLSIPLPIGISFFTFEGISLLVDSYRGTYDGRARALVSRSLGRHLRDTALFVSFFPHLIAGPILKARDYLPQIQAKALADVRWERAFKALVVGYFLKMVVADNLKDYTVGITYPFFLASPSSSLLVLLYGYSMQIFADFAGYSLIAIGLARLFGYELMENFRFPYVSRSFAEFWRRWHISLSTWLRDYLYIPLGGNRRGGARTYANLVIVMVLGGLWHGAAWSYAVWGLVHGLALAGERLVRERLRPAASVVMDATRMAFVFGVVTFAWLLFKLPDFDHVLAFLRAVVRNTGQGVPLGTSELGVLLFSTPVVLYHAQHLVAAARRDKLLHWIEVPGYATMLFLILLNSGPPGEFIYFQF